MSRNWFRRAILANVIYVLTDAITEASTRFANVELAAQPASYTVNDIRRTACEMVRNVQGRFRARNGGLRDDKRASVTTNATAPKSARFFVGRQSAFNKITTQISSALARK